MPSSGPGETLAPLLLPAAKWMRRRSHHEARVAPWVDARMARSSFGAKHPVYDFLFEYYSLRPTHLRRWHPGLGVILQGAEADAFLNFPLYERRLEGIAISTTNLKLTRFTFFRWLHTLLEASQDRPPFFGCAGLHEWAMVYRTPEVRHPAWPLRLGVTGTAAVVESSPIRCSHFDAFRFFTPPAKPLNRLLPTREAVAEFEQPGCLHANMDLYKWAYKLAPFSPSELVADAFTLARDIREVDMRASPYDFTALGFAPIPIETPAGRAEYETHQRAFAARSAPLRARLISLCAQLLGTRRVQPTDVPPPEA